jgi:hypothetical protein
MNLPFAEQAVVHDKKLLHYLLSPDHPEGRGKAEFFRMLGYEREHPHVLRRGLLELARTTNMVEVVTEYGTKYSGTGRIQTPSGKEALVVTVWILVEGKPPPVLVTAYPG